MTYEAAATAPRPADVGLRRELGLIGAIWSSETSIIGSGWLFGALFGALFAAQAAGTAALVGWVIAGVAVAILALVLAELGAMYPVSGGTARFPHFAFGSVGAAVLAPVAFIIANLLIYWSGLEVVWKLGVCIVVGYILIGIFMAFDKQRPPLDWKSAQWLPVYLVGLGIITWQGQYSGGAVGPPVNTGHIPFWWDMLVVAAFSLAIYYWAQATRLPRQEMMDLVNRQAAPAQRAAR